MNGANYIDAIMRVIPCNEPFAKYVLNLLIKDNDMPDLSLDDATLNAHFERAIARAESRSVMKNNGIDKVQPLYMETGMKRLSDLLEKELIRLKRRGARQCAVCDESYYEDEMRRLNKWTCLPCNAGES